MSPELIGILGVGVSLAALIWRVSSRMDGKIDGIRRDLTGLSERVAKLEGQMQILISGLMANGSLVFRTHAKAETKEE